MRLLVCGGRHYGCVLPDDPPKRHAQAQHERETLQRALSALHAKRHVDVLIHGAAPGADSHARVWASATGVPTIAFRADWKRGRSAGPRRNARMLAEGQPDMVLAFPGGRGTADMIGKALDAGVPVWQVEGSEMRRVRNG